MATIIHRFRLRNDGLEFTSCEERPGALAGEILVGCYHGSGDLILIYCFFHDFRSAMLILAGHVACCFVARNQLANESSGFHVLCPLGLEMEVCLIIVFTQLGKAIFS
jgi:hypothetical protein